MMGPYWIGNIFIVLIELALALMLLRNYHPLRRTGIGKRLFGVALVFVFQSILAIVFYVHWAEMGFGKSVAGPLLVLSLSGLVGVGLLYSISRM
ncbi:hypothetical protein A3L02_02900 [Thermococcus celer Vu 13 = JCM 8558]|uniref:Uncharacterized protein n=2 Tax=Thermococcus celer TaxID=2264 RepID=A0A218P0Y8_THECE|nr:hypothetical protein A3L02_02900 [Thermococcus celer Vu 13 = JCM 8558]